MLSERASALLKGRHFGVLATINRDGTPQLTTMWYLLEDDTIVMNTKVGRLKERNIRRNPYVSLCVQHGYQYVTIRGNVEIIDDPEIAQRDIFRRIIERYDEQVATWFAETRDREERVVTLLLPCEHILEHFGTDNTALMQKELEDGEQCIWKTDTYKTCSA